jgi:hypothetical protein
LVRIFPVDRRSTTVVNRTAGIVAFVTAKANEAASSSRYGRLSAPFLTWFDSADFRWHNPAFGDGLFA